uniref:NADH-ubiquinone oxidoreductase chain 4 n=1 Tax=Ophiophthalmus serratus TaxID=2993811 RepID=A0A9E8D0F7_9ECHI|nr:NADH dehydrogenase subunit 4 [Ophiophthalmus serratus]UZG65886.1 NADH dehydrogenase subunit 4 [Ophiophthalmus serratus]
MITLTYACLGIIITIIFLNFNNIWSTLFTQTTLLFFISSINLTNLNSPFFPCNISYNLATDNINLYLIFLSLWLIPVSLLASINNLNKFSINNIKIFSTIIIFILIFLIITFSSYNLLILFLGFEATLIPTIFLIAQWGAQFERIEASYYLVFYTLIGSLPLFLALLIIYNNENHLSIIQFTLNNVNINNYYLIVFCLIAFLIKVPIFGVHLWLPKAHVEAPIAGSMILAAILLKMGGYGFIRLITIFHYNIITQISPIIIPYCSWGGAIASVICLTQTDLKSLIAYSSVSHMSFMIAGASLLTNWSFIGGMFMLIAHGITSSALFAIANIYYERTNTRTLVISRGIKNSTTLMPIFWLIFTCSNLGIPPLPNSIAEIFLFSSVISFSNFNIISIVITTILTAIFSLSLFQLTSTGNSFNWNLTPILFQEREYLLLLLHIIPTFMIITNPNIITI